MHAISSYRGNRPTHTQTHTHKQTHRQDRLQYTALLSLARSVIVSGEAILSAANSENLWAVGAPGIPLGEFTVPPDPLTDGEGVVAPLQELHPRSQPSVLPSPMKKILDTPLFVNCSVRRVN